MNVAVVVLYVLDSNFSLVAYLFGYC